MTDQTKVTQQIIWPLIFLIPLFIGMWYGGPETWYLSILLYIWSAGIMVIHLEYEHLKYIANGKVDDETGTN